MAPVCFYVVPNRNYDCALVSVVSIQKVKDYFSDMTQSKIQSHLLFNEKVALKRKKLYEATM